jgi:hypothetical protein
MTQAPACPSYLTGFANDFSTEASSSALLEGAASLCVQAHECRASGTTMR